MSYYLPLEIMVHIGLDVTYVSQYMNLTIYNILSQESVCFAQGILGTPECTGAIHNRFMLGINAS